MLSKYLSKIRLAFKLLNKLYFFQIFLLWTKELTNHDGHKVRKVSDIIFLILFLFHTILEIKSVKFNTMHILHVLITLTTNNFRFAPTASKNKTLLSIRNLDISVYFTYIN